MTPLVVDDIFFQEGIDRPSKRIEEIGPLAYVLPVLLDDLTESITLDRL